eukprot:5360950-Amphidinium_carterae.2
MMSLLLWAWNGMVRGGGFTEVLFLARSLAHEKSGYLGAFGVTHEKKSPSLKTALPSMTLQWWILCRDDAFRTGERNLAANAI